MKNMLFLMLFLAARLVGQQVHFPDSNATWSIWSGKTEKCFVKGESLLNGKHYKKYFYTKDSAVTVGDYFALLREDTVNQRVYAIFGYGTKERLLYDFSLGIGDTVTVYSKFEGYTVGPWLVKIDTIDTVNIGGKNRKRLKVNGSGFQPYIEYWIEGIGSSYGLFYSGTSMAIIHDVILPNLICFEQDGVVAYMSPNVQKCYYPVPKGVSIASQWLTQLSLNVNTGMVSVNSEIVITAYKVESLTGQIIHQDSPHASAFSFDISDKNNGLYLLTLYADKGTVVRRIVKHD